MATTTTFVYGTVAYASRERTFVTGKGTTTVEKGAAVAAEFALGQQFVYAREGELLPPNSPSGQSHLFTGEG